jgi:hypothetical protein
MAMTGCVAKTPLPSEDPTPPITEPSDDGEPLAPLLHRSIEEFLVKPVRSPAPINYYVENPLEITNRSVQSDREVYISGLKDQAVQDKINDNLAALYDQIRTEGIPPYRGVRALIPEVTRMRIAQLEASVAYNYNDVLSIVVRYYKEYAVTDTRRANIVQGIETRNFDLATGNEIPLKYIFCDDVDYLSLLSDVMQSSYAGLKAAEESHGMFDWAPVPVLVAPFRGVRADQVYYLYEGDLCLVLDHRTPEFDVGFIGMDVRIRFDDFAGAVGFNRRFYDEAADLYVSEGQRAMVLPVGYFRQDAMLSEVVEYLGASHAYMVTYRMPPTVLPQVRDFVLGEFAGYLDIVNSFAGRGEGYWTLYKGIYVRHAGPFTMVVVTESINKLDKPITFLEELQWMLHSGDQSHSLQELYYCFGPAGEMLGLGDLFVPDFDYESLIRKAYDGIRGYEHMQRPPYDEVASQLQFVLQSRELDLFTPYLPTDYDHKQPIHFSIPYKDIGYNNMTIFP